MVELLTAHVHMKARILRWWVTNRHLLYSKGSQDKKGGIHCFREWSGISKCLCNGLLCLFLSHKLAIILYDMVSFHVNKLLVFPLVAAASFQQYLH